MDAPVVPALVVHGVRQDQLDLTRIHLVRQRRRQLEILVFVVTARRGGKEDHRPAELAEPEILHVPAEGWGEPAYMFSIHDYQN
jgi:hypothetical protein